MAHKKDDGGQYSTMSLRDYFAAKALAALIQKSFVSDCKGCEDGTACPALRLKVGGAYDYADAMLAERAK